MDAAECQVCEHHVFHVRIDDLFRTQTCPVCGSKYTVNIDEGIDDDGIDWYYLYLTLIEKHSITPPPA